MRPLTLAMLLVALSAPAAPARAAEGLAALMERADAFQAEQERELSVRSPAKGAVAATAESSTRARWSGMDKTYSEILSALRSQLSEATKKNRSKAREIRADIEKYSLDRDIARANDQALGRVVAHGSARAPAQAPPAPARDTQSSARPTTAQYGRVAEDDPDPMKTANACLEAGTCRLAAEAREGGPAGTSAASDSKSSAAAVDAPVARGFAASAADSPLTASPGYTGSGTYPAYEPARESPAIQAENPATGSELTADTPLSPSNDAGAPAVPIFAPDP
jgi:hypothetical protein